MSDIFKGRYTASTDEPFVVFLIGMRINRFWAFHKWLPVAAAMGPMLKTLYENPEKGFLGGETFFNGRTIASIQYWHSFEDLERFARQPSDPHLAAWKRFNQSVGADGSVGIWHETFIVQPGQYETLYGNMPAFGLASATQHVPANGRRETARRRLGGQNEPAMPSPQIPVTEKVEAA
jgi:hypothetical protein